MNTDKNIYTKLNKHDENKKSNSTRKKQPSLKTIRENKNKFGEITKKIASGEIKGTKKKITITDMLNEVKNEILVCKEGVENKKISYSFICQYLRDVTKINISEATLRKYCQTELGFKKSIRKKNYTNSSVGNKISHDSFFSNDPQNKS